MSQSGGEAHHARFARRILRSMVSPVSDPCHRGDVDDHTASPTTHRQDAEMNGEHDTVQVEVEGTKPMLWDRLREMGFRRAASVIDENVEPAEGPPGEVDHLPRTRLDGYVGQDKSTAASACLDPANGLSTALFVHVGDDDGRTLSRQPQGYRAAYTSTGSRHKSDLVLHTAMVLREVHAVTTVVSAQHPSRSER